MSPCIGVSGKQKSKFRIVMPIRCRFRPRAARATKGLTIGEVVASAGKFGRSSMKVSEIPLRHVVFSPDIGSLEADVAAYSSTWSGDE